MVQPGYHLGGNMEVGKDGKIALRTITKIKNVIDRTEKLLETKVRFCDCSMAEDHHSELKNMPFLNNWKSPIPNAKWIPKLDCCLSHIITSTLAKYVQP